MMVFEIILASLCGILLALVIRYWAGYMCKVGTSCKIKFSDFLKRYSINPKAWEIDTDGNYVSKLDGKLRHDLSCHFGYFDFIRYHRWARKRSRYLARQSELNIVKELLQSVQRDINRVRDQSQCELNEAESVTRRVMENPHPESPVEDFLKVWRNIKIH